MRRGLQFAAIALSGAIGLAGCGPGGGGNGGDEPPGMEGEGEIPAEISEGLVSIRVTMRPAYELVAGLTREFRAEGIYEDDSRRDVSAHATWASSDAAVLSFDDAARPNIAMVHAARTGALTVTATIGEIGGEMTIGGGCEYPRTTGTIGVGSTMPPLEWSLAARPDGSRGTFSLRDVYCGEAGAETPSVYVFVLGALWCGACIHEMALLAEEAGALREAGGQFVFVAVENQTYAPATTDDAMAQIGRLAGPHPVYAGGDADVGAAFGASGAFSALPSLVVVRTRDMKVIADTRSGAAGLDFEDVARDPDAGWENPPPPQIQSNCEPGREEASEPNNGPGEAARIGLGTHLGGVCDAWPDFYLVDVAGPWRATVDFAHAVGNLDLYAWDASGDAPLRVDQRVVGSYGVEDGEVMEHEGPTIIRIGGFRYESAPYTLTVEAL